jgi:hypothetical protein
VIRRTLIVHTVLTSILAAPLLAQTAVEGSLPCQVFIPAGGHTTSYIDGVPIGPSPEAGPNVSVRSDTISISGVIEVANSATELKGSCSIKGPKLSLILWPARRNVDWVAHATHPESYWAVYPATGPGQYLVSVKWPDSLTSLRDSVVVVRPPQ